MNIRQSILLALVSARGFAMADDPTKVIKEICGPLDRAFSKMDGAWYDKFATKTYVSIDLNGNKSNRAKAKASMKEMFGAMKDLKIETEVVSAGEKAGAIDATLHSKLSAKLPYGDDPKKGHIAGYVDYAMHCVKEDGMWKVSSMKTLKVVVDTLDGKPIRSGT